MALGIRVSHTHQLVDVRTRGPDRSLYCHHHREFPGDPGGGCESDEKLENRVRQVWECENMEVREYENSSPILPYSHTLILLYSHTLSSFLKFTHRLQNGFFFFCKTEPDHMIVFSGLIKCGDGNCGDAVMGNEIFCEDGIGLIRYIGVRIDLKIAAMSRQRFKTGFSHQLLKGIAFFLHETGKREKMNRLFQESRQRHLCGRKTAEGIKLMNLPEFF